MARTNAGRDLQAIMMGGGVTAGNVNLSGTGVTFTATTVTDTGAPFSTSNDKDTYRIVIALATGVWANVVTTTSTSVLTIDRWVNPATPYGANATTPTNTTGYVVINATAPAPWIGISANSSPSSSDTALTGEIVTSGGGLIRKASPYAHSASATTYTLTPVFTANGSDSLPVTVASIGVFCGNASTPTTEVGQPIFTTSLNATATLTASGDQLTVTETVTTA